MVLLRPIITEKSLSLAARSEFTFMVDPRVNAPQVAQAVRDHFKVTVLDVRMINTKGSSRIFRYKAGRTSDVKKAIVTLKKGDKIPGFTFDTKDEETTKKSDKHKHDHDYASVADSHETDSKVDEVKG